MKSLISTPQMGRQQRSRRMHPLTETRLKPILGGSSFKDGTMCGKALSRVLHGVCMEMQGDREKGGEP